MKRKGIILLFLIFFFMYILNVMTPLLSDDYFISFVWPEGVDAYPNSVGAQKVTDAGGALAAPLLALTKLIRKRHNILCNCCFSVRLNSDSFGERS